MKSWLAFFLFVLTLLTLILSMPEHVLSRRTSAIATYTLSGRVYRGETGLEQPNSSPMKA